MTLWIAVYDCGDYYCDGMHNLGVYDSEGKALSRIEAFKTSGKADYAYRFNAVSIELNADYDGEDIRV